MQATGMDGNMTEFGPGELIRVKPNNPYPPLTEAVVERMGEVELVKTVSSWKHDGFDYVQVEYPDGKLSGALYAVMFETDEAANSPFPVTPDG